MATTNFVDGQTPIPASWLNDVNTAVYTPGGISGTNVSNTPAGNISATTVQAAINELDAEKQIGTTALTSLSSMANTQAVMLASATMQYSPAANTDFNTLGAPGVYNFVASTSPNAPFGGMSWVWLEVFQYVNGNTNIYQRCTIMDLTGYDGYVYERNNQNGIWRGWIQIAGKMATSVEMTTGTEVNFRTYSPDLIRQAIAGVILKTELLLAGTSVAGPTGWTIADAICFGGGGGGDGTSLAGGGGAWSRKLITGSGGSLSYVIGSGGALSTNGGATSITGGQTAGGGISGASTQAGGTASGGDVNLSGQNGGNGAGGGGDVGGISIRTGSTLYGRGGGQTATGTQGCILITWYK